MDQELSNQEAKQVPEESKETMVMIADQLKPPKNYSQLAQEEEEAVVKAQLVPKQDISFYGKHKIKILACLSLLMTLVMVMLYFTFKEHCPFQSQFECVFQYIQPSLKSWVQKITVTCVLGVIQFHFFVHGTTYRLVPLGGIFLVGCLLFFSDQTISSFYYIGVINFAHVITYAFSIIVYSILMTFVFCFRKKKILFYATIGLILIASLLFYVIVLRQSCGYWEKGINGKIQKIDGLCNIKTPSICWYNVINGKIPPSLISNECFFGQAGKKYFNKFFKGAKAQGDFIAFPNINSFKEPELYDQAIQQYVTKYAKGYKTLEEAKLSPEKPDVVFDSENQIYHIDVQKNQTLIKERAEAWQKSQLSDSPPLAKNVLFLFIDTISRQSMHLKLPKALKWFQKQAVKESYFTDQVLDTTNNILNPNELKGEAYEFYRYNSLIPLTQPNLLAMFSGYRLQKQMYPGKMVPSVVKDFKSRGYITGSGNTLCAVNSISTSVAYNNSFQSSHYDHNSISFACDPNFQDLSSIYTYSKGNSMSGRRCLYGKVMYEYASEYALSFFQKYKDQPKLFSMHFLEAHEVTGDGANQLDEPISNILDKLDSGGYLDDTVVILISDHGMHIFMVSLRTENFYTERNLPGLIMRLPQKMNKMYRNKIRKNQQYIVTSINMHHFLKQIALGDKYEGKKQSILEDLTENKSCDKAGIYQPQYCSCK